MLEKRDLLKAQCSKHMGLGSPSLQASIFLLRVHYKTLPAQLPILLSPQPHRKEHHSLCHHPEDPILTPQVSQGLGFGKGQVLDETLRSCISAGTRRLSSGATTTIP